MYDIHEEKVLILDFGSQYTQLIARRVRESRVYCEIHPCNVDMAFIKGFGARGIILSGSPYSVHDDDAPTLPKEIFSLSVREKRNTSCKTMPIRRRSDERPAGDSSAPRPAMLWSRFGSR